MRSLITSIRIVAFSAVAITGAAAAVSAVTMVIDRHDLTVILVVLLLGVGLGAVLAAAVAGPLTADSAALSDAAEAVVGATSQPAAASTVMTSWVAPPAPST